MSRSDVEYDERTALQQWIDATSSSAADRAAPATAPADRRPPSASEPSDTTPVAVVAADTARMSARCATCSIDRPRRRSSAWPRRLQMSFQPAGRAAAQPRRAAVPLRGRAAAARRTSARCRWDVLIVDRPDDVQKATIAANARAWQDQVVVAKPLAMQAGHPRRGRDRAPHAGRRTPRRAAAAHASRSSAAGRARPQARDGPDRADGRAVPLVKAGQFVTITLKQGAVSIKTVAKAMEAGSYRPDDPREERGDERRVPGDPHRPADRDDEPVGRPRRRSPYQSSPAQES